MNKTIMSARVLFVISCFFTSQSNARECRNINKFVDGMYEIAEYVETDPDMDVTPAFERSVDELFAVLETLADAEEDQALQHSVRRMVDVWDKEEWTRRDSRDFKNALHSTNSNLDRLYKRNCSGRSSAGNAQSGAEGGGGGARQTVIHHAALAIDSNRGSRYGVAYNFGSKSAAHQGALKECGRDCTVVLSFQGGCGAYATDWSSGSSIYGWSTSAAADEAKRNAVNNCRNRGGSKCRVRIWGCNSN